MLHRLHPRKAVELSYKLFTYPKKGKIQKEKLPEILKNSRSERFQYQQQQFQTYTWEGNQTRILLVHGWESNAARWEKTLPYLKKSGSTIIAIDAPAHGQSSGEEFNVPRYAAFIHTAVQKFKPSIIIGHSIGGSACLYHQYLYPDTSIEKMVLLGAPADLKTLIDNYIKMLSLHKKMHALLEKRYLQNFDNELEGFYGGRLAKHIKIRGIVAHDSSDRVVSWEEGQKIAKGWEKGRLITTHDLGHSMHDEALYQEIYHFLFES